MEVFRRRSHKESKLNPKQIELIVNPISGTVNKDSIVEQARQVLESEGYNIIVNYTQKKGDATVFAQNAIRHRSSAVIAVGGDGTVNETASALCHSDVALGIIPCGSGNGLARHLNIPVDVEGSIRILKTNNIRHIDFCTMNGKKFFCTFGIGFDAQVTHAFSKQDHRGLPTYIKSALSEYLKYKSATYRLETGGKVLTEEAFIIAGANASQYGNNAYIAPKALIDDGLIDIIIVHKGSPIKRALMGVELFTGTIDQNTLIQTLRVPAVTITCETSETVPIHIDGEPMQASGAISLNCHNKGLKVIAPDVDERFTPIITPMNNMVRDAGIAIKHLFKPVNRNNKKDVNSR